MLKWCLLQDEKMVPVYKSLVFNNLRNVLIFRVFASEGESVRKYSLNFWGRTENSDGKIKIRLQLESRPYCFIQAERNNADSCLMSQSFSRNQSSLDFRRYVVSLSEGETAGCFAIVRVHHVSANLYNHSQ